MARVGTGYAYDQASPEKVTCLCEGCGVRASITDNGLAWQAFTNYATVCSLDCAIKTIERRWHLFYGISMLRQPFPRWLISYTEESRVLSSEFVQRASIGWEYELLRLRRMRDATSPPPSLMDLLLRNGACVDGQ